MYKYVQNMTELSKQLSADSSTGALWVFEVNAAWIKGKKGAGLCDTLAFLEHYSAITPPMACGAISKTSSVKRRHAGDFAEWARCLRGCAASLWPEWASFSHYLTAPATQWKKMSVLITSLCIHSYMVGDVCVFAWLSCPWQTFAYIECTSHVQKPTVDTRVYTCLLTHQLPRQALNLNECLFETYTLKTSRGIKVLLVWI